MNNSESATSRTMISADGQSRQDSAPRLPWRHSCTISVTRHSSGRAAISREYGARMFEFAWCDDFSAARNESLKHARGEWIFWMDSDDTIPEECGRKLRALVDADVAESLCDPAAASIDLQPRPSQGS